MKMKLAKTVLMVAGLLSLCVIAAWSDYTWDTRYQSRIGPDWILYDRQTNAIDPTYAWQIFKQPAHRIGLIKTSSIRKLSPSIYAYVLRWVDRGWSKTITEEDFLSFADCNSRLTGHLRHGADNSNPQLADIDWIKCDDNPYCRTNAEKERLRMAFADTCDLLNTHAPKLGGL